MHKKDQTFSKFCEFKALVEKESGKKIRALRSDNGGEYVSQEFKDFCAAEGIKWELTAPHNPQQNGVDERKNRTIMGETWAMIFVSTVYCHVTKDAQKKLESTTELGILVGYTDTPHNYWVYLPTNQRAVVRRDLKFDDKKAMRVSLERELQLQVVEEILVPKEEQPQTDAKQPHAEVPRLETSTQAESSRDGQKCTREADRLLSDARENVGEPSYQGKQRKSLDRYTRYMALVGECVETEPSSFKEVVKEPIWVDGMVEEYDSIVRNNVWDVVSRPENKSVVSSRWLYKVKQDADGSLEKHKARFVTRGFSQIEGIDYDEIFYPIARYSSIRSMLVLSAHMGWKIHQMDVKIAFFKKNGKIEEGCT
eukprot:PITA_24974